MSALVGPITQEQKLSNLESFLKNEKQDNVTSGSWFKLSKSLKIKKMMDFAETYQTEHSLADVSLEKLKLFLKECVDKNKINKAKDIVYNKKNGRIQKINILVYHQQNGKFTLKNTDTTKRVNTLKHMGKRQMSSELAINTSESTLEIEKDEI